MVEMAANASINAQINNQTRKSSINIADKLKNTQTVMYLL
jgi:hypothetical protein